MARSLLLAALLPVAFADDGCLHNNAMGDGVDHFTHKVEPIHSKNWDIAYFDTYKIITNKHLEQSYLLYLCGSEIPAGVNTDDYAATIEIPLKQVGLTQTPMVTYMEQLGARDKIAAFLTDEQYVWSPCFADRIEEGDVALLADRETDQTPVTFTGANAPDIANFVAFASQFDDPPFQDVVKVSESSEKSNAAIFEWVKFYSAFFNLEEVANDVVEAADFRFECIKEKTGLFATDSPTKPKVLWAYYSHYCGGWDVGECPNYYCEFAEACSVDILSSSEGSNAAAEALCFAKYMTTEEFVEFGKDADYWFYPNTNWNLTLTDFGDELASFKSVQDKAVFDYQGMGPNAWYERRLAQFYDAVDDMCIIVGTRPAGMLERLHFWRSVLDEDIPLSGSEATCTPEAAANILSDVDNDCALIKEEKTSSANGSSKFALNAAVSIILAQLFFVF
eukprot:CAMPEP_0198144958 /NCGR_PEP_ID=MMETSP1443-20131203/19901_1 /TAXON_ID=186043 /ORGANISM="Entomoneis sp., Strain CCMP2396" /LENGTH=448 /DNA_ID=CAMNT_0043808463 /DNA_START=90 /DNA_END=1436 /DNA_ORIENTATION=+